jgi:hypothetical protein
MKKILFILMFGLNVRAEVIESNRYADVLKYINSNTLFVTDLDNTVLRPPQTLGSDQWGSALQKELAAKGYPKEVAVDMGVSLFALVQMKTQVVPVEEEIPSLLQEIAKRGVPTLGLTARPLIIVDRTLIQLRSIGASLAGISRLDVDFGHGTIVYKKGVVFVGAHNNKGEILQRLLVENHLTDDIKRIVFIDDKVHHAEAVDAAFKGSGIEVISIRYGATDELVKNYDAALAQKEFEIFNLTGTIVSDSTVK